MAQIRFFHGTRKFLLTAASFRTWRSSQIFVAWDPILNTTSSGQTSQVKASTGNSTLLQRIAGYRAPLSPHLARQSLTGGEKGIRTPGRVAPTHAFQACSLNRSDISPRMTHIRHAYIVITTVRLRLINCHETYCTILLFISQCSILPWTGLTHEYLY